MIKSNSPSTYIYILDFEPLYIYEMDIDTTVLPGIYSGISIYDHLLVAENGFFSQESYPPLTYS